MANFWEDNHDIQFCNEHFLDWDAIIPTFEDGFADGKKYQETKDAKYEYAPNNVAEALDNYRGVWDAYAQIIDGELTPHTLAMDKIGLKFEDGKVIPPEVQENFINTLKKTGVLVYAIGRQFGGQNFSQAARLAITEMVSRADAGTQIIISYYNMAEMIEYFGDEEMKNHYLPKFIAGDYLGAMALTEPNIGSDLTNATTKAVHKKGSSNPREFELTGTKTFITQGCGFGEDTDAAIFTIARSLDKKGAFGLSFFLVETKDVKVARIEEKLGLHSSATCELTYDKSKGILIGDEGAGLVKYAIKMMNGARIGIACQSMGIAQAAYSMAKEYAASRVQFGKEIEKLVPVKRLLNEMLTRVQASRALIYRTGEAVDMQMALSNNLQKTGADERAIRKDADVAKWDKISKVLTPLSKFTASEWACMVAYDGVQIHGGVGYTEEYEIAKIYRDARITSIYEGTTQLQVLAIIGGIVEGAKESSIFNIYFHEELAKIKDEKVKSKIASYFKQLTDHVAVYKEQEQEVKEDIALEMCWHLAHTIMVLLVAQQLEMAKEVKHPVVEEKTLVLKTLIDLSEAQIAGGNAYIKAKCS